jgi:hypothetical protein
MEKPLFVFIKIPEALETTEREEKYEQSLEESLASTELGELTGGGAMLSAPDNNGHREIVYCGIDVELFDADPGLELLKTELKRLGAPRGTILEYTLDEIPHQTDLYEPGVMN